MHDTEHIAPEAPPHPGEAAAPPSWLRRAARRVRAVLLRRTTRREPTRRQRGIAILVVLVTTAVIGATAGDFAYNAQVDVEAAVNSRDQLRAEYLARSGMQLGLLLVAVQNGLSSMLSALPAEFRDAIVITDYAGFLAKAFGGDAEAREGLGGLVGIDLSAVEGLGTARGTTFDLNITSEEGKYPINCAGGLAPTAAAQQNLYLLISNLIRPLRYDRMFNIADRDGVVITREDLPAAIIDWSDIDPLRYNPLGPASASEDRYDKGQDRYEAHNQYYDTTEEVTLVRGVSEDFWAAFGEMFTVYGSADCKVMANAIQTDAWPLVAAMIAASSSDRNAVFDPNTAIVAQQVAGVLKTGLPALKALSQQVSIPACKVDKNQCPQTTTNTTTNTTTKPPATTKGNTTTGSGDSVELLSNLICSDYIARLPQLGESLAMMTGGTAPPTPTVGLRPIPMCPGRLAQYLRDSSSGATTGTTTGLGAGNGSKNPRRYYRIDATGIAQRSATKQTQVHIRGVWNAQATNSNPLCTNHPSCFKGGTWVYYRMD